MTDEKEFIWVTHQKGSIKYYSEAAYVKLQSEVERLKNACDFSGRVSTLEAKLQAAEAEIETLKLDPYPLAEKLFKVTKERDQLLDDARRLAEALELVVEQFEDMQDSNDIQEHWHKIAREALTPEIRKKYLK